MSLFPGSLASFLGFTSGHTLSADQHAAQHNSEQAEIIAAQTKIGTGASTPASGLLLRGSGAGTSAWGQVILTSDVSGVLPQANGGTGTTLATGTGKAVYDTAPTVSNPTFTGGGSWAGSPSLTTPVIADHTNATHTHASAAQGGLLNGANAITPATLQAAQMFKGMVNQRQGGTTGNGSWATTGTSNTDTSAKDAFFQAGSFAFSGSTTITFPVAFTQVPIVVGTVTSASALNAFFRISAITATGFTAQLIGDAGGNATESGNWIAVGQ